MEIFLSASVPLPNRNPQFFATADIISIREAIKALAVYVGQRGRLTFGGHPAITPLITAVIKQTSPQSIKNFVLYQSEFFAKKFPKENSEFIDVRIVPEVDNDQQRSLLAMRHAMIDSARFDAAFFIGGMEGIADEYNILNERQPGTPCYPVGSTGGASLMLHNQIKGSDDLINELSYLTLFRKKLGR